MASFGTEPQPQGFANPSIDELMEHTDSQYALSIFAAKRARQINSYFTQLNEGLLQNVGPLVEYQNQEKPLSIAFREINEGLLEETLGEDDLSEGN
ncbi:DNA-directed RNA polymerase subunit omega [Bombiscardovia coagulans]|uniref:DNA-directed RNA polymerase subunit omega n=1 Tax=Bombiscardovia coagulans TaxID=686666 RepID=A0A261ETF1_9BIFI|nr:DNA-directed RNA polymerase subunit omega [Bombiscardovia coagulans]OZG50130.1 DNA-directed RNA polymerase subunit omega [Bombiscardovia coagulans]